MESKTQRKVNKMVKKIPYQNVQQNEEFVNNFMEIGLFMTQNDFVIITYLFIFIINLHKQFKLFYILDQLKIFKPNITRKII